MQATTKIKLHSDDAEIKAAYLREVSLFSDLVCNEESLRYLAGLAEEVEFSRSSKIITEGDVGSEMFVLISGQASVFKTTPQGDQYNVAILRGEQKAFFGEGALLASDARSATIVADTDCHCLVLSRKRFEEFENSAPKWALLILKRIARTVMARMSKSNDDLMLLYNALVAEIQGK